MKMSHEYLNTLIASVGLIIAVVTAWYQFGPAPDKIDVQVAGRVDLGVPLVKGNRFPDLEGKKSKHLAGPIFWRVVLYNNLDRAVSVLNIDTFLSGETGGLIQYSDMLAGIFEPVSPPSPLVLPLTIEPRHAKAFIIGLNIPVIAEDPKNTTCFKPGASSHDIEVCLFSQGRDFFGNLVDYTEYPDPPGKPAVHASWPKGFESPTFFAVMQSGDGSEFIARIQYYPIPQ